MLTERRQELILDLLSRKGSITVSEIKEKFNASESTIRRDLNYLHKMGRLTKVFGGAVLKEQSLITEELSVSQKSNVNLENKNRIAEYAAGLITKGDFIYLDAGTTTECMLQYVTEKSAVFVTNAVAHAKKLANAGYKVILIGGELKGTTEAVVGSEAVMSIHNYHFTKGFFGTNGITVKAGYTTPDYNEALVKKTAMLNCQKRYILADSSKFGEVSAVTFGEIEAAKIITNENPGEAFKNLDNIVVI